MVDACHSSTGGPRLTLTGPNPLQSKTWWRIARSCRARLATRLSTSTCLGCSSTSLRRGGGCALHSQGGWACRPWQGAGCEGWHAKGTSAPSRRSLPSHTRSTCPCLPARALRRYDAIWVQWCLLYLTDGGCGSRGAWSFRRLPFACHSLCLPATACYSLACLHRLPWAGSTSVHSL